VRNEFTSCLIVAFSHGLINYIELIGNYLVASARRVEKLTPQRKIYFHWDAIHALDRGLRISSRFFLSLSLSLLYFAA